MLRGEGVGFKNLFPCEYEQCLSVVAKFSTHKRIHKSVCVKSSIIFVCLYKASLHKNTVHSSVIAKLSTDIYLSRLLSETPLWYKGVFRL